MDLHVFLYDGIVRDKDPADRDAASDVGCYFTVGAQTFTSDILLNTNEPNFRTFFEFDCQAKDTPYTLECYDQDMMLPLKREDQLVYRASSDEWPASGERATLADKEDGNAAYVMSYKFVYERDGDGRGDGDRVGARGDGQGGGGAAAAGRGHAEPGPGRGRDDLKYGAAPVVAHSVP